MLTIDGRTGGGQLLRTALTLAAITGTPFEMTDVRAERPSPGLRPQHLSAVRAVGSLCGAEVEGATIDSTSLAFRPGAIRPRSRHVDVGTAGSVTLLFDAVLPLAVAVDRPVHLTATGGTDVRWSPTEAYLRLVKVTLLARFGLAAEVVLGRTGFYPVGEGRARLVVEPSSLDPIVVPERGALERVEVFSKASEGLAASEVADRQADRAIAMLGAAGLPVDAPEVDYVDSASPGSSLLLRAVYAHSVAGFDALGARGKPSERVAEEAFDRFLAFHRGPGSVDEHLADQLLVFLALAGGRYRAPRMTAHVASNAAVLSRFGIEVRLDQAADGSVLLEA